MFVAVKLEISMDEKREKCMECGSSFSNLTNMRRHVKKFHPNKIDQLAPFRYKNSINFAFSCNVCKKNFNHKAHLRFHMKVHTEVQRSECIIPNPLTKNAKKCGLCSYQSSFKKEMQDHLQNVHEVPIKIKTLEFSSADEFTDWKLSLEHDTNSRFIKKKTKTCKTHVTTNYVCHRSGNFLSEGKNVRHLKTQGSNKINTYCPASITLVSTDDKWTVSFTETHVGHDTDIEHLTLTNHERKSLVAKIAAKIPFDEILDQVRSSVTHSTLKRIHLLTRRDLYNIERCYNLSSTAMRHPNDAVSVESLINELRNDGENVIFYKSQGVIIEDKPELKSSDFVLIIMTPAQCEFLNKYGSDCICLDGTHGLNNYNFELNTLLVIDDMREGFPCAFLFSNRSDTEVFKLFFSEIKKVTGVITPRVFMSDLADSFFNAWVEIMGAPQKRLYCTWHVDRAWRKNLNKIKGREKQVEVYKELRTTLQETDQTAFLRMLQSFCSSTDGDNLQFKKYFKENYFNNREQWAYCFRLHCGLNTNMNLERMHRTLKYIYLKGKKVKRLDKALVALMRFVRDKLFDRIIVVHKGKICSKLRTLRARHKTIGNLDATCLSPVEGGWQLPSKNRNEIYFTEEKMTACTCRLICTQCEACIHRYVCSCLDSSIKFNMCKHIHLLAMFRRNERNEPLLDPGINTTGGSLRIDLPGEYNLEDSSVVLSQLNNRTATSVSLNLEKDKIMARISQHLSEIQSPTKLEIIKKILQPLTPTLVAVESQKSSYLSGSSGNNNPANGKIAVQRQLFSTKKCGPKKESHIFKPDSEEVEKIAANLLLNNPE